MNGSKSISKRLAVIGMTAGLYFVLTMALSGLAYNEVQFRLSEILCLLAFVNPIFAPGVILGTFISNLFSPFGLPDIIFGTLATTVAMFPVTRTKNLLMAAVYPVICCLIVSAEIFFFFTEPPRDLTAYFFISLSVLGGEAAVMLLVGLPVFKFFILKNERLTAYLKGI